MTEQTPQQPTASSASPAPAESLQSQQAQEAPPAPGAPPGAVQVRIRRAPRYRAFVLVGAIVGLLAGVITAIVLGGGTGSFSPTTVSGYVGAIGLLVGGLLGAAVAVLVERPRSR